jgi:hypothetical protein
MQARRNEVQAVADALNDAGLPLEYLEKRA